jgi:hypothetical protein
VAAAVPDLDLGSGTVLLGAPAAHADNDVNTLSPNNHRLSDGVVANVFTVQHQAGCTNGVKINPQLQLAAQWQTHDVPRLCMMAS